MVIIDEVHQDFTRLLHRDKQTSTLIRTIEHIYDRTIQAVKSQTVHPHCSTSIIYNMGGRGGREREREGGREGGRERAREGERVRGRGRGRDRERERERGESGERDQEGSEAILGGR